MSPAVPPRVRVLSLCAAVALHGAMAATALLYTSPPVTTSTPAFEVILVAAAAPEPSGAAEPVAAMVDPAPEPLPPEPPVVAEAPAPPSDVAPLRVEALPAPAPVAEAWLPPAPRPRPSRPASVASPAPVAQPSEPPRAAAPPEAPAIAAAPAPRAVVSHGDADYIAALLGWLARYKDYPRAARLRRIEGTAMVRLAILADGSLGALSLARSSGHAVLDDAAIDMVRRAAPLPQPPHAPCELEVPVVFAQGRP